MNVSISLLIIFGTVFLVGEHVLARTLETGRAGGYYTHSGKGDRSARARFERFKSRKTPTTRTSITPISVSDQYGNRYRGDLITSTYDPVSYTHLTLPTSGTWSPVKNCQGRRSSGLSRISVTPSGSRKTGKGGQGSCRQDGKGFVPARQTGNNG